MSIARTWSQFLFPDTLRDNLHLVTDFAKNRRTYVMGYQDAAAQVGRPDIESINSQLSPLFKEDPRRYIPVEGWRGLLVPNGEYFGDGKYNVPPPTQRHKHCHAWGPFGKDQPIYAWRQSPMRLFDAVKVIAALYDAQERTPGAPLPSASTDGILHKPGEISLHLAVYTAPGFNHDYYQAHFAGAANANRRRRLAAACGLFPDFSGSEVPTFYEMSEGLCVTHRTAQAVANFVAIEGLPTVDPPSLVTAARGSSRTHRQKVKRKRKGENDNGPFSGFSADCAIELFNR